MFRSMTFRSMLEGFMHTPANRRAADGRINVARPPSMRISVARESENPKTGFRDTAFPEPHIRRYSGLIRVAIVIGAPIALWIAILKIASFAASLKH
jgi:hypothetical protein